MNHDNSRLTYTELESPGQPLRSQAEYHNAGPAPARGDEESNLAHQQLAVNTAIESAKELEAGLITEMALSCAAGKWDGDNPPGDRGVVCRSVIGRRANSVGGSKLESEIIGLATDLLMPVALKFTGMFWDVHGQYHILERLARDIGSESGHYSFVKQ